jgi:hypothetical protein
MTDGWKDKKENRYQPNCDDMVKKKSTGGAAYLMY